MYCKYTGKKCFTRQQAGSAINWFKRKNRRMNLGKKMPKRFYYCEYCNMYHLTHWKKWKEQY